MPRWVFRYVGNKTFDFSSKKRIFCPKTTQFGPKLAFLTIAGSFGALLMGWLVARGLYLARHLFTLFYWFPINRRRLPLTLQDFGPWVSNKLHWPISLVWTYKKNKWYYLNNFVNDFLYNTRLFWSARSSVSCLDYIKLADFVAVTPAVPPCFQPIKIPCDRALLPDPVW